MPLSRFMVSWILAWSLRRRSSSSSRSRWACLARNFSISSAIMRSCADPGAAGAAAMAARTGGATGAPAAAAAAVASVLSAAGAPRIRAAASADTGARESTDATNARMRPSWASSAGVRAVPAPADGAALSTAPPGAALRFRRATISSMMTCSLRPTLTRIFWPSRGKSLRSLTACMAPSALPKVQNPKALGRSVSLSIVRFHLSTPPHCLSIASTKLSWTARGSLPTKTFMGTRAIVGSSPPPAAGAAAATGAGGGAYAAGGGGGGAAGAGGGGGAGCWYICGCCWYMGCWYICCGGG